MQNNQKNRFFLKKKSQIVKKKLIKNLEINLGKKTKKNSKKKKN
jgi:hypothetical protein